MWNKICLHSGINVDFYLLVFTGLSTKCKIFILLSQNCPFLIINVCSLWSLQNAGLSLTVLNVCVLLFSCNGEFAFNSEDWRGS